MTSVAPNTLTDEQRGFQLLEMESGVKPQLLDGNKYMTALVITGILTLAFLIMFVASIWSSIVVSRQRKATYAKDPTLRRRKGQSWFYFIIWAFPITTFLALVSSAYTVYALSNTTAVEPVRAEALKAERELFEQMRARAQEAEQQQQQQQQETENPDLQTLGQSVESVGQAIESTIQNLANAE